MKTIFSEVAQRGQRRSLRAMRTAIAMAWALALSSALAQTPGAAATDASNGNATVVPAAAAASASVNPAAGRDAASSLESFAWLHGCWAGKVNQRDFREDWLPPRGDMMIGMSQTVVQGKTQDFEYLRLEVRPEGIFYVAVPSGKKETAFRFAGKTLDGANELFTFENPVDEFPQRIVYRHGTEGWLYAQVEGKINDSPRTAIYPMRNIDCMSGEVVRH